MEREGGKEFIPHVGLHELYDNYLVLSYSYNDND
jgi:hypothetical protein